MTRAEQPTAHQPAADDALVADSRERAVRALLRRPQLKRLWGAQLVAGVGDTLALLVLILLALQAAIAEGGQFIASGAQSPKSIGYESVILMNKILNKEAFEFRTPVETFLINKDNVAQYGTDGWQ